MTIPEEIEVSRFQWFWSACALGLLWANAAVAQSAEFHTLNSFANTNGAYPWAQLLLASDGNLYGTTQYGGNLTKCPSGCGTIFKITPRGKLTTIHKFDGKDGSGPLAGLIQGANGNLYGVAPEGGILYPPNVPNGAGTVFEITLAGKLTVLHKFDDVDAYAHGRSPVGGLMSASDGNFYGTTNEGGPADLGTIFKMTPAGALTTLWDFDYSNYGAFPVSTLVETKAGDFYGTADGGLDGAGVAFEYSAKGKFTVLHTFTGNADGGVPTAGLLVGTDGNLYGATENGGQYLYYGTIFKLTPAGHLTTLHSFNVTDGDVPWGTLLQGMDGNFYGTTSYGGSTPNWGTVFKMTPSGKITSVHQFDLTDGAFVYAGLIQAPDGTFYGDTFAGGSSTACGTYGCGTVFSLRLGKK
jgi:uncharacterized repeat protein (TIGR03803 family)